MILKPKPMILQPRVILKPKNDSETKDDSATKDTWKPKRHDLAMNLDTCLTCQKPPRIWRRCHVECGRKCVRGRNAAARTLLSHPTPPHPTPPPRIWRRCHVECGRKCVRGRNIGNAAARAQDVIIPPHPTPPHPPRHLETMLCWLWLQLWRGCWFLSHADGGWGMACFWLRNPLVLVAESPFFGCGIVFFLVAESVLFWLRKRLFLVAEACLILVAESPKFGCGSVAIWFRNRTLFLYTLPSTLHTLHSTLYTSHSTLYTLHSTLYTLNFTLYTYTPHSTL